MTCLLRTIPFHHPNNSKKEKKNARNANVLMLLLFWKASNKRSIVFLTSIRLTYEVILEECQFRLHDLSTWNKRLSSSKRSGTCNKVRWRGWMQCTTLSWQTFQIFFGLHPDFFELLRSETTTYLLRCQWLSKESFRQHEPLLSIIQKCSQIINRQPISRTHINSIEHT